LRYFYDEYRHMAPPIDTALRVIARQRSNEGRLTHTAWSWHANNFGRKSSQGVIDPLFKDREVFHELGMRKLAGLNIAAKVLGWRHSSFSPVVRFTMVISGASSYETMAG
jgi:hypothetical protein